MNPQNVRYILYNTFVHAGMKECGPILKAGPRILNLKQFSHRREPICCPHMTATHLGYVNMANIEKHWCGTPDGDSTYIKTQFNALQQYLHTETSMVSRIPPLSKSGRGVISVIICRYICCSKHLNMSNISWNYEQTLIYKLMDEFVVNVTMSVQQRTIGSQWPNT